MIDTYEFFDRAAYDRIWGVSWKTLRHRNLGNPWFWPVFEGFDANEDGAGTLHQLLGFSIEPQPTDRQIKGFLKRLKVGETVVRCSPQSFAMSELLQHTIASPERFTLSVELKDPFSFIGIAVQAFLSKRISAASLWSVVKLHSLTDFEFLQLQPEQSQLLNKSLPWSRMWSPIYKWQGNKALAGDQWTNCLGVADTRRFMDFVSNAYRGNWKNLPSHGNSSKIRLRLRDDPNSVVLAKGLLRLHKFERPCVVRSWE